jgi:hypothetical protein
MHRHVPSRGTREHFMNYGIKDSFERPSSEKSYFVDPSESAQKIIAQIFRAIQ